MPVSPPRIVGSIFRQAVRVLRALIGSAIPPALVLVLMNRGILDDPLATPLLLATGAVPVVTLLRLLAPDVLDDVKRAQEYRPSLLSMKGGDKTS
jgi:hypothetical protein